MKTKHFVLPSLMVLLTACAHTRDAKVDLTTPQSTVIGFTKAAAAGDAKLAQSYFLPGGTDYQDIVAVLTAAPGTPKYPGRLMLGSVDTARPITVKSQKETGHGLKVVWQVTFGKSFEVQGQKVQPGTEYDFDATLKKTDQGWLIDNF